jgi:4'-phosphopantetheinyl transferase
MNNRKNSVFCDDLLAVAWQNAANCNFKVNSAADIWHLPLSANHPYLPQLFQCLNNQEQIRANSYVRVVDAKRYIICRATLKRLLALYSNKSVVEIELQYRDNRKPFLTSDDLKPEFNVTHSGDLAMIAIGNDDVGIDLEMVENDFSYGEILDHFFSKAEINAIRTATAPRNLFYKLWTRKEALLKATGVGIINALNEVEVLNGPRKLDGRLIGSDKDFKISSFSVDDAYVASVSTTAIDLKFYHVNLQTLPG